MKKKLSEEDVKKKVKFNNYSELDETKAKKLISILPNVNESDVKNIEKYIVNNPTVAITFIKSLENIYDKALSSNDINMNKVYEVYKIELDTLSNAVKSDGFTNEQKMELIKILDDTVKRFDKKDSENKKFIATVCGVTAIGIGAAIVGAMFYKNNNNIGDKS